jgi:hypothetical protein
MIDDAVKLVSIGEASQRFSRKMKAPTQTVQLITLSWPLKRWGNDIIRKLTPAQSNYTFVVVEVEYFTKWLEAKLLTNVSSVPIRKFLWQNIICRYGVPRHITVDNTKYFNNGCSKSSTTKLGRRSPSHQYTTHN